MASLRELIGWHLGNVLPMTDLDWQILRLVQPGSVLFLAGECIKREDIERILEINPRCHVFVRQYLDPGKIAPADRRDRRDYSCVGQYIDDCKRALDDWSWLPRGQRHFQFFNEQNMPVWNQWEGFGDTPADMVAFNREFCRVAMALRAHAPDWPIAFTPLTPGNRDAYFLTDHGGMPYYMHGPEAACDNPSEADIKRAIASGPCREALALCDEYLAHIYCNDPNREPINAPWGGLRFARYAKFIPAGMPIWITECGCTTYGQIDQGAGERLVQWYQLLTQYPQVKGTMLWALGENLGRIWYDGGQPRREVYMLKEMLEGEAPVVAPPADEPPVIVGPPAIPEPPVGLSTHDQALWQLWWRRDDVRDKMTANGWPDWFTATQQWLRITTETEIAADPVAYARKQGWMPMNAVPIDGRLMTPKQFAEHMAGLPARPIRLVCAHHTAIPTGQDWAQHGGWEHYKVSMAQYYAQERGWTVGPHIFVSDEGIGLFTPLTEDGAGAYGHNDNVWHVEVVGDYTNHLPAGKTLEHTVATLATLLKKANLGIEGLTYHKALNPPGGQYPSTECPGAAWIAQWEWFKGLVAVALQPKRKGLPSDETATDAPTLMEKVRWWTEEAIREREAGEVARADAILLDLVDRERGLMYRLERTLKG